MSTFEVGRRRLFRGSVIAGAGAVVLTSMRPAVAHAADASSATAGDHQFVPAPAFLTTAAIRAGWPAVEYINAESSFHASFALPTNVSIVTVDVIWMAETPGPGTVRWAGGLSWAESTVALDDPASSAGWKAVNTAVPTTPKAPATSRLGEFNVSHTSPGLHLQLTREGASAEDTFNDSVHLLGLSVTVTATIPLA